MAKAITSKAPSALQKSTRAATAAAVNAGSDRGVAPELRHAMIEEAAVLLRATQRV